jgi:hypothetical protein
MPRNPRKPPAWWVAGEPCPKCGQLHPRCAAHPTKRPNQPCGVRPVNGHWVCQSHGARSGKVKASAAQRVAKAETEAEIRGFLQQLGDTEPVDYLVALEELYLGKLQEVRVLRWAVRSKQEAELTWGRSETTTGKDGDRIIERAGLSVLLTWMHKAESQLTEILALCDRAGMTAKRKEYLDRIGASVALAMQAFATSMIAHLEDASVPGVVIRRLKDDAPALAREALLTLAVLQETPGGD